MSWRDKLNQTADKVVKGTGKAVSQGRTKMEEIQLERQMDATARKLGYMAYDEFKGQMLDEKAQQTLLNELATLEEQLAQAGKEEVEAEEAEEDVHASTAAGSSPRPDPPSEPGGSPSQPGGST